MDAQRQQFPVVCREENPLCPASGTAGFSPGIRRISSVFTDLILTGVAAGFPELMKSYSQVMDNLGMNSPTILSALYTLLLAPATEELIFRGLTLGILERAFPFWQANLLQAACFGLIHGNPVQGIYAFGAGLILAF